MRAEMFIRVLDDARDLDGFVVLLGPLHLAQVLEHVPHRLVWLGELADVVDVDDHLRRMSKDVIELSTHNGLCLVKDRARGSEDGDGSASLDNDEAVAEDFRATLTVFLIAIVLLLSVLVGEVAEDPLVLDCNEDALAISRISFRSAMKRKGWMLDIVADETLRKFKKKRPE